MEYQQIIGFIIFIMFVIAVFSNRKLQVFLLFILGLGSFIYMIERNEASLPKVENKEKEAISFHTIVSRISNRKNMNISPVQNNKKSTNYSDSMELIKNVIRGNDRKNNEVVEYPRYIADGNWFVQFGAYKNEGKAEMVLLNIQNELPVYKNFIFIYFDEITTLHRVIVLGFKNERRAQHFIHKHHLSAIARSL